MKLNIKGDMGVDLKANQKGYMRKALQNRIKDQI
jgi:hypothetical protein